MAVVLAAAAAVVVATLWRSRAVASRYDISGSPPDLAARVPSAADRASLLSLLELFPATATEAAAQAARNAAEGAYDVAGSGAVAPDASPAAWDVAGANAFERGFLAARGPALRAALAAAWGWELLHLPEGCGSSGGGPAVVLRVREGPWGGVRIVRVAEVAAARAALDASLASPDGFPFAPATRRAAAGALARMARECPWVDASRVGQLRLVPNAVSGEAFMVPYEIGWQTEASALVITFPDVGTLPEAHLRAKRRGRLPGAAMRDFFAATFYTVAHEAVHVMQGLAAQVDRSPGSWSAEHDASRVPLLLLREISEDPAMADLLPPGAFEEILMVYHARCLRMVARWDERKWAEYWRLRDSYGLVPIDRSLGDDLSFHTQVKTVLALESFEWRRAALREHLQLMFKDRSGVAVQDVPLVVPPSLARRREGALWSCCHAPRPVREAEEDGVTCRCGCGCCCCC